jgi:hypothetical protein
MLTSELANETRKIKANPTASLFADLHVAKHVYHSLLVSGRRSTCFSPGGWLIRALIATEPNNVQT